MSFLAGRSFKIIKTLLLLPETEKIMLLVFLLLIPIVAFYSSDSSQQIKFNNFQKLINRQNFKNIQTTDQFYKWFIDDILVLYDNQRPAPIQFLNEIELLLYQDTSIYNQSNCLYQTCPENKLNLRNINIQSYGDIYTQTNYNISIPQNNSLNFLQQLQQNQWIGPNTKLLIIQFQIQNNVELYFAYFRGIIEYDVRGNILTQIFTFGTLPWLNSSGFFLVLSLYIIAIVVYIVKIMIEINYKIYNLQILAQLLYIISLLSNIIFIFMKTINSYQIGNDIDILIKCCNILQYQNLTFFLLFCAYPFRVVRFLAWYNQFQWIRKFMTTIVRIIPGYVMTSLIALILIYSSCSLLSFILFSNSLTITQDQSIISYLAYILNFSLKNELSQPDQQFTELQYIAICISFVLFVVVIAYFFSIVSDIFQKASTIVFPHSMKYDDSLKEQSIQLYEKTQNLLRDLEKHFQTAQQAKNDVKRNEKILVFFELSEQYEKNDIFNENQKDESIISLIRGLLLENDITFRTFYTLNEITNFIIYLTKIRPEFLSQRAGDRFRVLFHIRDINYMEKEQVLKQMSHFFKTLKDQFCKYPVLIYMDDQMPQILDLAIKNIYQYVYHTQNFQTTRYFCLMQESWKIWSKKLNYQVSNEEEQESMEKNSYANHSLSFSQGI